MKSALKEFDDENPILGLFLKPTTREEMEDTICADGEPAIYPLVTSWEYGGQELHNPSIASNKDGWELSVCLVNRMVHQANAERIAGQDRARSFDFS